MTHKRYGREEEQLLANQFIGINTGSQWEAKCHPQKILNPFKILSNLPWRWNLCLVHPLACGSWDCLVMVSESHSGPVCRPWPQETSTSPACLFGHSVLEPEAHCMEPEAACWEELTTKTSVGVPANPSSNHQTCQQRSLWDDSSSFKSLSKWGPRHSGVSVYLLHYGVLFPDSPWSITSVSLWVVVLSF